MYLWDRSKIFVFYLFDEVVHLTGGCGSAGGSAHGGLHDAGVHVQVLKLLLELVHHLAWCIQSASGVKNKCNGNTGTADVNR